jgi:adenine-specific DNA methylase
MREKANNNNKYQILLLTDDAVFPSTRFQGSKAKIVDWVWDTIKDLEFNSVLDAFGGTGCVGYMLKSKDKRVTYNDILKFNWYIGTALIENSYVKLMDEDVTFVLDKHKHIEYPTFVTDTFRGIYFTDEENEWIDRVVTNIEHLSNLYKKAIAYFALFQACIIKRPFNLFHRKNLYIRLADVERNFGNKTTWDTPFETHFRQFVAEANQAVFSNGQENKALNNDALNVEGDFDLVYIDTPYVSSKGIGVDYLNFYHFIEGLVHYPDWDKMIDYRTKHRRFKQTTSVWTDKRKITSAFDQLFRKFRDSILVVSYRADGIPSISDLVSLLRQYKSHVQELDRTEYKYVLSTNESAEVLLIGR